MTDLVEIVMDTLIAQGYLVNSRMVEAVIAAARPLIEAEEREACAKVAEHYTDEDDEGCCHSTAFWIASAIRNRSAEND